MHYPMSVPVKPSSQHVKSTYGSIVHVKRHDKRSANFSSFQSFVEGEDEGGRDGKDKRSRDGEEEQGMSHPHVD